MDELIQKIKKARLIWICGNGGSAATAEHFATDLVKKGYPAIALSSNTSVITMIANDYGYEYIFSVQLERYAREGDLLVTISCSGTSRNIENAQELALYKGLNMYSFEIFSKDKDYQRLEDKHLQFAHKVITQL